jgi:spermidine synthase
MGMKKIVVLILFVLIVMQIINTKTPTLQYKTLFSSDESKVYVFEIENGDKTYRKLTFENNLQSYATQSAIFVNTPEEIALKYYKIMLYSLSFVKNPSNILVLGMGAGIMPAQISKYYPNACIDVVEINPDLPYVAKQYFNFPESKNINIYIQDAYEFVMKAQQKQYDLILFDVFDETYIPQQFLSKNFMLQIGDILKENGIAAFNTFTNSKTYKQEEKLITSSFDYSYEIIQENRILFTSNSDFIQYEIPKELEKQINFKKYSRKIIKK